MAKTVQEILDDDGPMLSSQVIESLRTSGLSASAARQRVSRARGPVKRLDKLEFKNRSRFLYLSNQYGTTQYWERLFDALESLPIYARILGAMRARGGAIPLELFNTFSGAPASPLKGHPLSQSILKRLKLYDIINEDQDSLLGPIIKTNKEIEFSYDLDEIKARHLAESILIQGIKQWLKRIGLVSYGKVKIRGDENPPMFGQFRWDLTAPSYVHPFRNRLVKNGKPQPGFVVCDVLLAHQLKRNEIKFHIDKCAILRSQRNTRPFMSILVGEGYEEDAFQERGKAGLILTNPDDLLGNEIAAALKSLINLLASKARNATGKSIHDLFSSLNKIEGAAQNLRGPLFELIAGRLANHIYTGSFDLGKKGADPKTGERFEFDVFLEARNAIHMIECKGKEPGGTVGNDDVDDWLTRQVPRMRRWVRSQPRFSRHELNFELWIAGEFESEALALLKMSKVKTKAYKLDWKDGGEIIKIAQDQNEGHLSSVLKEHFIKHPLRI